MTPETTIKMELEVKSTLNKFTLDNFLIIRGYKNIFNGIPEQQVEQIKEAIIDHSKITLLMFAESMHVSIINTLEACGIRWPPDEQIKEWENESKPTPTKE